MAMSMALAKHGFLLQEKEEELYEIIDAAMSVAAWRNPEEFVSRRDQIAKNLFSLPEDVIGSCYLKCHSSMMSTNNSDVTKALVSENSNIVADDYTKKSSKVKLRLKPFRMVDQKSEASKGINSSKIVAAMINKDERKMDEQNFGASKVKSSESVATNSNIDGFLDQKFEASKRKLEQRYRQLGESARKTKVIDFMEIKDLTKPPRGVKRPRFRR